MAVKLFYAKGFAQEAALEPGIDSGRITKWRQSHKCPGQAPTARLSEEQKQIKQLQKELEEAQLEPQHFPSLLERILTAFLNLTGSAPGYHALTGPPSTPSVSFYFLPVRPSDPLSHQ